MKGSRIHAYLIDSGHSVAHAKRKVAIWLYTVAETFRRRWTGSCRRDKQILFYESVPLIEIVLRVDAVVDEAVDGHVEGAVCGHFGSLVIIETIRARRDVVEVFRIYYDSLALGNRGLNHSIGAWVDEGWADQFLSRD